MASLPESSIKLWSPRVRRAGWMLFTLTAIPITVLLFATLMIAVTADPTWDAYRRVRPDGRFIQIKGTSSYKIVVNWGVSRDGKTYPGNPFTQHQTISGQSGLELYRGESVEQLPNGVPVLTYMTYAGHVVALWFWLLFVATIAFVMTGSRPVVRAYWWAFGRPRGEGFEVVQ